MLSGTTEYGEHPFGHNTWAWLSVDMETLVAMMSGCVLRNPGSVFILASHVSQTSLVGLFGIS
jgi:hypothetical protein